MKRLLFAICIFISSVVSAETIVADFNGVTSSSKLEDFPTGWTYVTNNPNYPNPDYNKNANKFNFINEGMLSPQFGSSDKVVVTMNVALNENTKTSAGGDNVLTFYGLNNGDTVVVNYENEVVAGDNEYVLEGEIDQVLIKFTAYPYNGDKYCNIAVYKVTIETQDLQTDVKTIFTKDKVTKVLENNKVYIYKNNTRYNIYGIAE